MERIAYHVCAKHGDRLIDGICPVSTCADTKANPIYDRSKNWQCQSCHAIKDDYTAPVCCDAKMEPMINGFRRMIIPDIQTYRAVAVDKETGKAPVITSRSKHREFLKRNGYVEVGNEMPKQRTETRGDYNVRGDLARAAEQVLSRQ